MNLLVHASAGALIGQYTGNPILGFIYGIISHLFLDIIPHGDSKLYQKYKSGEFSAKKAKAMTITDGLLTIVFILIFFNLDIHKSLLVSSVAIFGSLLPDILMGFYELLEPGAPKWLNTLHTWHFKNHNLFATKKDFSFKSGLLLQLITFLLLLKIL